VWLFDGSGWWWWRWWWHGLKGVREFVGLVAGKGAADCGCQSRLEGTGEREVLGYYAGRAFVF
jgi:hypothetical protein